VVTRYYKDVSALHASGTEEENFLTQQGSLLSQNRFEDTHERLGKLVIQIILRVDRDVVLENV
jgi:hypothetical protein